MHTWSKKDQFGKTVSIHFNGDFSGHAIICDDHNQEIKVEMDVILEFVVENYIRPKKMETIENAEWRELFDL